MGILFVVALILAWPTFGLSIVAWFALQAIKKKVASSAQDELRSSIEPLFNNKFAEFFMALDIPSYEWEKISSEDAHQCGRHIVNYICHNPSEANLFFRGVSRWRGSAADNLPSPVTAADSEKKLNKKAEVHMVSYRAIEALMTNNKLRCFASIDLASVIERKAVLELRFNFP